MSLRRRISQLALAAMIGVAAIAAPASARADDPPKQEELPKRSANYSWSQPTKENPRAVPVLQASFSFRDMVDDTVQKKLNGGVPVVVAIRAYVLKEGEANPVALAVRTCRVVYDLWEEVYRLRISGPGGDRNLAASGTQGVIRNCFEAADLPIVERSLLAVGKPYFLGVIVEIDPVSSEQIEQMRRWVSRPAGSTGIGPGDALFGSFVGLFVRQMGTAFKTLRFRTQTITP